MYDRICDKLDAIIEEMGRKEKLSASDLQILDWATHIKKSMLATEESEYSERSYEDRSYHGRRRDRMGRYASDGYSRERSRDGSYADHLRDMMENAPDEKTRQGLQKMLRDME